MGRFARCWVAAVACAAAMQGAAFADGVAYAAARHESLSPVRQHEQRAAINWRDGIERMVIAVGLDMGEHQKGLWIFPVPGRPEQVHVDVTDAFPHLSGKDPREVARDGTRLLLAAMLLSQLYTAGPFAMFVTSLSRSRGVHPGGRVGASVHERMEKWGIHVETVTARSTDALRRYLSGKQIDIVAENLTSFRPYLSDEYVLVLVWIESRAELLEKFPEYAAGRMQRGRWPCVYVEFPSEAPFYPLRPTAAYGELVVTANIFLTGYFESEPDPDMERLANISHFESRPARRLPAAFWRGVNAGLVPCTRVSIVCPAKYLTADLRFRPTRLEGLTVAHIVAPVVSFPGVLLLYVVLQGLVSYLCAGLAGLDVYRSWRRTAVLGLWNLLGLPGVIAATCCASNGDAEPPLRRAEQFVTTYIWAAFLLLIIPLVGIMIPVALFWIATWPRSLGALIGLLALVGLLVIWGSVAFLRARRRRELAIPAKPRQFLLMFSICYAIAVLALGAFSMAALGALLPEELI